MSFAFFCISIQAVLGAVNNLWHHEVTERLPAEHAAVTALLLRAAREFLYGFLFLGLAWHQWHGWWTLAVAAVVSAETIITLADFLVEDRTRYLPPLERVLHTLLAINFGVVVSLLFPALLGWWRQPTALLYQPNAFSWVFTVFAAGVLAWSLRHVLSAIRLARPAEWVRDPIESGASTGRTVLISGATGFVGGHLVRHLVRHGDSVLVLARNPDQALNRFGPHVRVASSLDAIDAAESIDAVVNLAGATFLGLPWTARRRERLISGRVQATRDLIKFMARLSHPPKVLLSASAIGYYNVLEDESVDEHSDSDGSFQSRLGREWEKAARDAELLGMRVARVRLGLVLGSDGGTLRTLALVHRLGLGAVLGSGRQWISWIHIDDLVRLFRFLLVTPAARGAFNAVSPLPVRHRLFQENLASQLHRPLWLRIPAPILRLALGEMSQRLVDGQRVLPNRTVSMGFRYRHERLPQALADLLGGRRDPSRADATEVYFNGECPVCRFEMRHYAAICITSAPQVRFIDSSHDVAALVRFGLRREHLERRVYARHADGRLVSGMSALLELWARMPGYSLVAKLLALPAIRTVAELAYDHLVAPGLAAWAARRSKRMAARRPANSQ